MVLAFLNGTKKKYSLFNSILFKSVQYAMSVDYRWNVFGWCLTKLPLDLLVTCFLHLFTLECQLMPKVPEASKGMYRTFRIYCTDQVLPVVR